MNNENINRLVEETLNSLEHSKRAVPKPFLFTRITGKMQKAEDRAWDNALRFLSRPAVAMACILLVIAVNALVFTFNHTGDTVAASEEQYTSIADDYSTVTVLHDIENIEP
jgi:membrane-bound ClpP family serine protease